MTNVKIHDWEDVVAARGLSPEKSAELNAKIRDEILGVTQAEVDEHLKAVHPWFDLVKARHRFTDDQTERYLMIQDEGALIDAYGPPPEKRAELDMQIKQELSCMDRMYIVGFRTKVDDYYHYRHIEDLYSFLIQLRRNEAVILFMFSEEGANPACMDNLLARAKEENQRIGARIRFVSG